MTRPSDSNPLCELFQRKSLTTISETFSIEEPLGLGHVPRPRNFTIAIVARIGRFPCRLVPAIFTQIDPPGVLDQTSINFSKIKYRPRGSVFYFGGATGA